MMFEKTTDYQTGRADGRYLSVAFGKSRVLLKLSLSAVLSYHLLKRSQFKEQCHKILRNMNIQEQKGLHR